MKYAFFYLVGAAVIFEIVADVLFKYWSIDARSIFLWAGVALYGLSTIIWANSLRFEMLSKAITIFTVLNLVIVVLAGVVLFNENLTIVNKIGILLGVLSVVLVQL